MDGNGRTYQIVAVVKDFENGRPVAYDDKGGKYLLPGKNSLSRGDMVGFNGRGWRQIEPEPQRPTLQVTSGIYPTAAKERKDKHRDVTRKLSKPFIMANEMNVQYY